MSGEDGRHARTFPVVALGMAVAVAAACDDAAEVAPTASLEPAWFEEATLEAGIDFVHRAGATGHHWLPEIMGPGLALFDAEGDGDLDLYVLDGNDSLPAGGSENGGRANRLYVQTASGAFEDRSAESGLADEGYGMGVATGDFDNDGAVDVYVSNFGADRLFRNGGDVSFADATESARVSVAGFSSSAGFLDFDRDGFLDLFVARYIRLDPEKRCTDPAGRHDYCSPRSYAPETDVLLRNLGGRRFEDVSRETRIDSRAAAGLGVAFDDFDGDGWLDVYVANDAYENHMWRNANGRSFEDVALLWGVAFNLHGRAEAGMGVVAADFDLDQAPDLFVTHLFQESNTLYRAVAPGIYDDTTGGSGLAGSSVPFTGFGVSAFDFELDGDVDLFVANGRVLRGPPHDGAFPETPWKSYAEPNLAYRNDGTGRFSLLGAAAGSLAASVEITRGSAVGDLDGDGDMDLVVSNTEGPTRLYRNEAPRAGSWLILSVRDEALKRAAHGARVFVTAGGRTWRAVVGSTAGYLSASDARLHFGLGDNQAFDHVDVHWLGGGKERFAGGEANRALTLVRGGGERLP